MKGFLGINQQFKSSNHCGPVYDERFGYGSRPLNLAILMAWDIIQYQKQLQGLFNQ